MGNLRAVAIFALTFFILSLAPTASMACKCVESTPEEAFKNHDAVFQGTVLQIEEKKRAEETVVVVLLEVSNTWKGVVNTQVLIETSVGSCMYSGFVKGKEYVIYANQVEGTLYTSLCDPTTKVTAAGEYLSFLGEGKPPTNEVKIEIPTFNESTTPFIWIGFGILVIFLVYLGIKQIRKSR